MGDVSFIGLDQAKHVFQAHGAAADGPEVFWRKLSRAQSGWSHHQYRADGGFRAIRPAQYSCAI